MTNKEKLYLVKVAGGAGVMNSTARLFGPALERLGKLAPGTVAKNAPKVANPSKIRLKPSTPPKPSGAPAKSKPVSPPKATDAQTKYRLGLFGKGKQEPSSTARIIQSAVK